MRAHQRESQSCYPTSGKGESSTIKKLEEKLRTLIGHGRALGTGNGTFEETQRNAAERVKVEAELKQARKETKHDKQAVKDLAQASMSAANWTQVSSIHSAGRHLGMVKLDDVCRTLCSATKHRPDQRQHIIAHMPFIHLTALYCTAPHRTDHIPPYPIPSHTTSSYPVLSKSAQSYRF